MEKKGCSYKCNITIYTSTLYMYIHYTCESVFGQVGFVMGWLWGGRFPGLLCIRKLLILPGRRLDRINQASQKVWPFILKRTTTPTEPHVFGPRHSSNNPLLCCFALQKPPLRVHARLCVRVFVYVYVYVCACVYLVIYIYSLYIYTQKPTSVAY